MAKRKKVTDAVQAEVLVRSRRRCCVCFGLRRDENEKVGQIAHLDKDPANDAERNLVYLCLDHHDQFDSRTSQSKNLTKAEVEAYRNELFDHFSLWGSHMEAHTLLNYLAATISEDDIAKTVLKVSHEMSSVPDFEITMALTETAFELSDLDLVLPLLHLLDSLASWGFLTYEVEEDTDAYLYSFKISHRNIDTAKRIAKVALKMERESREGGSGQRI